MLPVGQHLHAVDPDVANADRQSVRVFERCLVSHLLGIEHHEIGEKSRPQLTTVT